MTLLSDLSHVSITELTDELTYRNYAYNRDRSPEMAPDRYRLLYGAKVDAMERRYQAEHSQHFIEASEDADLEADRRHDERKLGEHG